MTKYKRALIYNSYFIGTITDKRIHARNNRPPFYVKKSITPYVI